MYLRVASRDGSQSGFELELDAALDCRLFSATLSPNEKTG
jgi:hypothetical protein